MATAPRATGPPVERSSRRTLRRRPSTCWPGTMRWSSSGRAPSHAYATAIPQASARPIASTVSSRVPNAHAAT